MRCPNCRTLTLVPPGEREPSGRLVHCPRCPAVWLVRPGEEAAEVPAAPMTRRGPLIVEGKALSGDGVPGGSPDTGPGPHASALRRYGLAAGAAMLVLALVAMVLLAPDVSALPGIALLEGAR